MQRADATAGGRFISALVDKPFITVIIYASDGFILAFGTSKQNPTDAWDLERGIKIAQVRAYRNYKALSR